MIEDVYDPLLRYRNEYAAKFSELTSEKFSKLVKASGIDVEENRRTIAEIKKLTSQADSNKTKSILFGLLILVSAIVIFIGIISAINNPDSYLFYGIVAGVLGIVCVVFSTRKYLHLAKIIKGLEVMISQKTKLAWRQMESLNNLYTWDIPVKLIEATVPRLQFDAYFSAERLDALHRLFGWDNSFNDDKSILFAQSGVINGNPFVLGEYLQQIWGEHTYTGTKSISWTERVYINGKTQYIRRHQTLYANVTKPIPVYKTKKLLIYGNDAAENLRFSRNPSSLSDDGDGVIASIRKKWVVSRLKAHSRNLEDDCDFTLMSNHDFEALFYAKNRDNEVEFRMLFTAMAQRQMLDLLKDTSVGYGDDFTFIKDKKINIIIPEHLAEATIDTNPKIFYDFDFDKAMLNFKYFNEKYFKDVFFSIAPVLAIPLYQQTRHFEDIYKDVIDKSASFWEHEASANYHGEHCFKHVNSITRNILKTNQISRNGDLSVVEVTAYGFRGIEHIEHKNVLGGDGNWHTVSVKWIEYLPVEKTTKMCVSENKDVANKHQQHSENGIWRRNIYSYLNF